MRGVLATMVAVAGLAACGPPEELAQVQAPLTATDVDVAPECNGYMTFVNTASYETLHVYVPSNVANNIIAARPMGALAALIAVDQVGPTRLQTLYNASVSLGYINASSCVGLYDNLLVSADDAAAIVSLVNGISDQEMHDILPYAWNGAVALLAGRPFTTAAQVSNTAGIGPVSMRNLRNAATLSRPFEQLAAAVNGVYGQARLLRHFDWYQELQNANYAYRLSGMTCFGVDPALLPNGAEIRPNLADATEVYNAASYTVTYANYFINPDIDGTAGLANLQSVTAGKAFFGCYIEYANDPWSGHTIRFFVDQVAGVEVLAETWWSE